MKLQIKILLTTSSSILFVLECYTTISTSQPLICFGKTDGTSEYFAAIVIWCGISLMMHKSRKIKNFIQSRVDTVKKFIFNYVDSRDFKITYWVVRKVMEHFCIEKQKNTLWLSRLPNRFNFKRTYQPSVKASHATQNSFISWRLGEEKTIIKEIVSFIVLGEATNYLNYNFEIE